ncbi:MAG: hypothetical protein ACREHE_07830 [Rhizomicrobium sp.]
MKIALHIETLVLDGLSGGPGYGARVGAAVTRELETLIRNGGLPAGATSGGARPGAPAPQIRLSTGASPRTAGQKIAGSVYRGIGAGK